MDAPKYTAICHELTEMYYLFPCCVKKIASKKSKAEEVEEAGT